MRRAVITLGSTLAGLAALLSFKTHSLASGVSAQGTPVMPATASPAMAGGTGTSPTPAATRSGSAKSGTAKSGTAKSGSANSGSAKAGGGASASPKASTNAVAARTITGAVANTQYGPMQVEVTLMGQRITGVTVVQQTNVGARSQQIDSFAVPQLTKETLAAQSARIDAVSGASYTSSGYIQSLQSALDQAAA